MRRQNEDEKRAEISFRAKLFEQHVKGITVFDDEFDRKQNIEIMKSRMDKSTVQFKKLLDKGLTLSPFLEIGAERCQRSLALQNKFHEHGFAIDLSFESLRTADYLMNEFKMEEIPVRICCDAYNLPFRNNSFPFVFCYQTLHHFPNPAPIIKEIKRVLARGCFFFDEEPVKQFFNLKLYKRKNKMYSVTERSKNKIITLIEHFISTKSCNEEEFGLVENEEISIREWKEFFKDFDYADIELRAPFISCKLNQPRFGLKRTILNLTGSIISGYCYTRKKSEHTPKKDIFECLGCPNCLEVEPNCDITKCRFECKSSCENNAIEIKTEKATILEDKCVMCGECSRNCPIYAINKSRLKRENDKFICKNCGKEYLFINNILILFSKEATFYDQLDLIP